jgi:lipoate-protein ligase A
LLFQGRKLVGSAQRRFRRSFLQHGSIPLQIRYKRMAEVLHGQESDLRAAMVSVSEAVSGNVRFADLVPVLRDTFLEGLQNERPRLEKPTDL